MRGPASSNWYIAANWLSRHLWEHYQYTRDREFLAAAYPVMRGAAVFTLDWLQRDAQDHWVTMPSTSPEKVYSYQQGNQTLHGNVTVVSTLDVGIVKDLFTSVMSASAVVGTDQAFREQLASTVAELFPLQGGSQGQLQEWYRDFEDVDAHHRHTSHLYALYPGHEISPLNTPALAAAAKRTLELRGDDGTGWSLAWKVNM